MNEKTPTLFVLLANMEEIARGLNDLYPDERAALLDFIQNAGLYAAAIHQLRRLLSEAAKKKQNNA